MPGNLPTTPRGLVIALQYWWGDRDDALRLARLIADIEPAPRQDVTVALVRRYDMLEIGDLERETIERLRSRFPVMTFRSKRSGVGHPDGCNAQAAGTMEHLSDLWRAGDLHREAAFLIEADGCPLRADWISCIAEAHRWAVTTGKAITGAYMSDVPHVNGSMVIPFSWWVDHPSVWRTPPGHAWDLFHADTIWAAARPTARIANHHGARGWEPEQLKAMSREIAWLASTKDGSAKSWAERELVAR